MSEVCMQQTMTLLAFIPGIEVRYDPHLISHRHRYGQCDAAVEVQNDYSNDIFRILTDTDKGQRGKPYPRQKIQEELMTQSARSFCICTSRLSPLSSIRTSLVFTTSTHLFCRDIASMLLSGKACLTQQIRLLAQLRAGDIVLSRLLLHGDPVQNVPVILY